MVPNIELLSWHRAHGINPRGWQNRLVVPVLIEKIKLSCPILHEWVSRASLIELNAAIKWAIEQWESQAPTAVQLEETGEWFTREYLRPGRRTFDR